ncbi:TIGR03747 family integrating conjugative element membrane protein [Babesia caballi]|uniref:TIGR03747 family integrating conjugative element membrane protein n=1 Tax=Babesia caballi TaxID=5871 RepID=A0AAV4LRD2_BABCB|nr:TIGR03747 family integrating conjugative element membrane protein [Babesia caballi]
MTTVVTNKPLKAISHRFKKAVDAARFKDFLGYRIILKFADSAAKLTTFIVPLTNTVLPANPQKPIDDIFQVFGPVGELSLLPTHLAGHPLTPNYHNNTGEQGGPVHSLAN